MNGSGSGLHVFRGMYIVTPAAVWDDFQSLCETVTKYQLEFRATKIIVYSLVDAKMSVSCTKIQSLIPNRRLCIGLDFDMCLTDFQLNSHLTTLASIHKIHHTLHRLVSTHWHLCFTCEFSVTYYKHVSFSILCDRTWQKTLDRIATPQVLISPAPCVFHSLTKWGVLKWMYLPVYLDKISIIYCFKLPSCHFIFHLLA